MARKRPAQATAAEDLALLVQELQQSPADRKRKAAVTVAKLSSSNGANREKLAQLGAIPPLVAMLEDYGSVEALSAISSLTVDSPGNCAKVVSLRAIPLLVSLLKRGISFAAEAAEVLRNLAIENETNCLEIEASGGVPPLVSMLHSDSKDRRHAIETLESIASVDCTTTAWTTLATTESFRSCVAVNLASDHPVFCPALSVLTGIDGTNIAQITRDVAIPYCVKLLRDQDDRKRICGADFIQILAMGNGNYDVLQQHDAIQHLVNMLNGSIQAQEKAITVLQLFMDKFESSGVKMVNHGAIQLLFPMANGKRKPLKPKATVLLKKLQMISQKLIQATPLSDQVDLEDNGDDDDGGDESSNNMYRINTLNQRHARATGNQPTRLKPKLNMEYERNAPVLNQTVFGARWFMSDSSSSSDDSSDTSSSNNSSECSSIDQDQASEVAKNLQSLRGTLEEMTTGAKELAKLTRNSEVNCTEIVRQGGIPLLVAALQRCFKLNQYAAEALSNLASRNHVNCVLIAEHGAIPHLAALLNGPMMQQSCAAKALRNLAADNESNQKEIQQSGAVPLLLRMLEGYSLQIRDAAATLEIMVNSGDLDWIDIGKRDEIISLVVLFPSYKFDFLIPKLSALVGITNRNSREIVRLLVIPHCSCLLRGGNNAQVDFAVNALKHFAKISDANRVWITQNDVITDLVALLDTNHKRVAANVIGLLAQNSVANQIAISQNGAIPLLHAMSNGPKKEKTQALFALKTLANVLNMNGGDASPLRTNLTLGTTQKRRFRSCVAFFKATKGRMSLLALKRLTGIDDDNLVWIARHVAIPYYILLLQDKKTIRGTKLIKTLESVGNGKIDSILRCEIVCLIMNLLSHSNDIKIKAAETLTVLSRNETKRLEMVRLGLVSILFKIPKYGVDFVSKVVALLKILRKCNGEWLDKNDLNSTIDRSQSLESSLCHKDIERFADTTHYDDLSVLVQELRQPPVDQARIAAVLVANLAHTGSAKRIELVQAGVIHPLVCMLKSQSIEAVIALSALAVKSRENRATMVSYGAIPLLIIMLKSHAAHESAHTLRRLAFDNEANYFEIVSNKGIESLVLMLEGTKNAQKQAAKTLEVLASIDNEAAWTRLVFKENVRSCVALIQMTKGFQALPMLSKLAGIDQSDLDWHIQHVAIPYYVYLLSSSNQQKKACAAECLEKLAKFGSKKFVAVIVQHDALRFLVSLLRCNDTVKRTAIKALTVLTQCEANCVEVVRLGAIPLLIGATSDREKLDRKSATLYKCLSKVNLKSLGLEIEQQDITQWMSNGDSESEISDDDELVCDVDVLVSGQKLFHVDQKYEESPVANAVDRRAARTFIYLAGEETRHAQAVPTNDHVKEPNAVDSQVDASIEQLVTDDMYPSATSSTVYPGSSGGNCDFTRPIDVSQLIGWLSGTDDETSFALKVLAQGHDTELSKLVEAGGIPLLVDLLRGTPIQKKHSVALLTILASENQENRIQMVQHSAVPLLIDLLRGRKFKLSSSIADASLQHRKQVQDLIALLGIAKTQWLRGAVMIPVQTA